jgi:hypothetical protein
LNINDVPDDQGGWVFVEFHRSFLDTEALSDRSSADYYIQIKYNDIWITAASSPTYGEDYYTVLTPTLVDSSDISDGIMDFRIIANMEEGNVVSGSVQGFSVDNLAPLTKFPSSILAMIRKSIIPSEISDESTNVGVSTV